jgi:cytochrome c oxidase subunit III
MEETHALSQTRRPSGLQLGLMVFVILAVLTAAEFLFALFLNVWPLLVLMAFLKGGLVLVYYMHFPRLFEADKDENRESFSYKLTTNRMGLWFFMLSDAFVFGGLMVSRFNLLALTRPQVDQLMGLGITTMLLVSSFFANRAEVSMEHGNRRQAIISLSITIILGLAFLATVLFVEWRIAPFGPGDGVQGAVFYSMTGFHAFHVLTGIFFLSLVLRNLIRQRYSAEKHWGVEAAIVYWHFIDVVWIFFYPALYLIGSLPH